MRRKQNSSKASTPDKIQLRPLRWWWVASSGAVVILAGISTGVWLWHQARTLPDLERIKTQAESTRIALTAAGGVGAALALLLAFRRQRSTEASNQDVQHDATEKRVTELYTKAIEQLGSDKAAVRLGGLYALKRLAQDSPGQRATVIEVVCAYLRMSTSSDVVLESSETEGKGEAEPLPERSQAEEHQVRLAAQSILSTHLDASRIETYWGPLQVNLTGARLADFDLTNCVIGPIDLSFATLVGNTDARECTFTKSADFTRANFQQSVRFDKSDFQGESTFEGATFKGFADFEEVIMQRSTSFLDASFDDISTFRKAHFQDEITFTSTKFAREVNFSTATFGGRAEFIETNFSGSATFAKSTFINEVVFYEAKFLGSAHFWNTTFARDSIFSRAMFRAGTSFVACAFMNDTLFKQAEFWRTADFSSSSFPGKAIFEGAKFIRGALFNRAEFWDAITFRSAQFLGALRRLEPNSIDRANFTDCIIAMSALSQHEFWWSPQFALAGIQLLGEDWGTLVHADSLPAIEAR
ncbi:pentapeptide repeat-containing protein [Saccharothrix deserti]|uniref:pentapeptide repeat-containing protein n=1 Tax=Saccharothrix deserti TaxID=2593674 RepID=UPI00131B0A84|nr:pentapeptide repeat-containing protein [Saccharothrix deserti]